MFYLEDSASGALHELLHPGKTTVGRGKSNAIQPESPSVSKKHAIIDINSQNKIILNDLGSRNGTFVGAPGNWNHVKENCQVSVGDFIKFGQSATYYKLVNKEKVLSNTDSPLQKSIPRVPISHTEVVKTDDILSKESKRDGNVMISIQYPSTMLSEQRPVSIVINPSDRQPLSSDSSTLDTVRNSMTGNATRQHLAFEENSVAATEDFDYAFNNRISRRSRLSPIPENAVLSSATIQREGNPYQGKYGDDISVTEMSPPPSYPDSHENDIVYTNRVQAHGIQAFTPPISRNRYSGESNNEGERDDSPRTGDLIEDNLNEKQLDHSEQLVLEEYLSAAKLSATAQQEVESIRKEFSDKVREANRVLAGVANYEEWKLSQSSDFMKIHETDGEVQQVDVIPSDVESNNHKSKLNASDRPQTNFKNTYDVSVQDDDVLLGSRKAESIRRNQQRASLGTSSNQQRASLGTSSNHMLLPKASLGDSWSNGTQTIKGSDRSKAKENHPESSDMIDLNAQNKNKYLERHNEQISHLERKPNIKKPKKDIYNIQNNNTKMKGKKKIGQEENQNQLNISGQQIAAGIHTNKPKSKVSTSNSQSSHINEGGTSWIAAMRKASQYNPEKFSIPPTSVLASQDVLESVIQQHELPVEESIRGKLKVAVIGLEQLRRSLHSNKKEFNGSDDMPLSRSIDLCSLDDSLDLLDDALRSDLFVRLSHKSLKNKSNKNEKRNKKLNESVKNSQVHTVGKVMSIISHDAEGRVDANEIDDDSDNDEVDELSEEAGADLLGLQNQIQHLVDAVDNLRQIRSQQQEDVLGGGEEMGDSPRDLHEQGARREELHQAAGMAKNKRDPLLGGGSSDSLLDLLRSGVDDVLLGAEGLSEDVRRLEEEALAVLSANDDDERPVYDAGDVVDDGDPEELADEENSDAQDDAEKDDGYAMVDAEGRARSSANKPMQRRNGNMESLTGEGDSLLRSVRVDISKDGELRLRLVPSENDVLMTRNSQRDESKHNLNAISENKLLQESLLGLRHQHTTENNMKSSLDNIRRSKQSMLEDKDAEYKEDIVERKSLKGTDVKNALASAPHRSTTEDESKLLADAKAQAEIEYANRIAILKSEWDSSLNQTSEQIKKMFSKQLNLGSKIISSIFAAYNKKILRKSLSKWKEFSEHRMLNSLSYKEKKKLKLKRYL